MVGTTPFSALQISEYISGGIEEIRETGVLDPIYPQMMRIIRRAVIKYPAMTCTLSIFSAVPSQETIAATIVQ
jgi:hypothetical protein